MKPTFEAATQSSESAAFWTAFWPSFWSGSASGVVTGLVTGLVVGFILLRYQRGVEARSAAKGYAHDLSVKLSSLRVALTRDDVLSIVSVERAAPQAASDAIEILKECPLTLWRDSLPSQIQLIGLAIKLQNSYSDYSKLAAEADQLLKQEVRSFNHKRGAISANDPVLHQFGTGMLFEAPIDKMLPWLSSHGPSSSQYYVDAWSQISLNPRLAELGTSLRAARHELKEIAHQLVAAIDA